MKSLFYFTELTKHILLISWFPKNFRIKMLVSSNVLEYYSINIKNI